MRDLVDRARAGDRQAFGLLVERYWGVALATAHASLRNFHDAEEIAQEALLQAWAALPGLREPERFPAWLSRIVMRRASNFRARWRQEALPLEGIDEVAWSGEAQRDHAAASEAAAVADALALLPLPTRMATTLFYLGGYSVNEVAALLAV